MFKLIRVFILLFTLVIVAGTAWQLKKRSVEWEYDLPVNLYLINADGSEHTSEYLRSLSADNFKPMENFMREESARYDRNGKATIEVKLGGILDEVPPEPPQHGSALETMWWSLNMRWWSFRHGDADGPSLQVKMYLLYHDPSLTSRVPHSTGLQKGLVGRVNVFASAEMAKQNLVVITHELLHTLGATDKYDPATDQPIYPDGYAFPDQDPALPQQFAEIMAGRTPITQNSAVIPESLGYAVIGTATAKEINW